MTMKEVAGAVYRAPSTITKAVMHNAIQPAIVRSLDDILHITPSTYVIPQQEPEQEAQADQKQELDISPSTAEALYKIIHDAVYEAVKQAWSE